MVGRLSRLCTRFTGQLWVRIDAWGVISSTGLCRSGRRVAIRLLGMPSVLVPLASGKLAPLVEKAGFPEKDINTGLKMFDS